MAKTTTLDEIRRRRPDIGAAFDSLTSQLSRAETLDFISVVREVMRDYGGADAERASADVTITPVDANGVAAQYFVPRGAVGARRLMYVHGGAWVAGTLQSYQALAATLARLSGLPLLLVDYRLAPEHPFPAGLDDCAAAFDWFCAHGPAGQGATESPLLAGDSAGGNLAAALTMKRIQSGQQVPVRLALIAGVLDVSASDFTARHDPLGGNDSTASSLAAYTQDLDPARNPLISPLCASDDVLAAFPPTLLQASADEFLMGCSAAFGRRLREQGVRSVVSAWPMVPHVWHQFLDTLPEARSALGEIAAFLNQET